MNTPTTYRNIDCTRCDQRLVSIRGTETIFHGPRPIDLTARPAEEQAIVVCHVCGNLVPLDHDIIRLL